MMKRKNTARRVTGKGGKRRAGPDRPKPGDRRPKPLPRPRPPKRPKPGDRMILPPRPRKNPKPKLPKAIMELTPEQRRRFMQLVKKGRRKTRPIRKMK